MVAILLGSLSCSNNLVGNYHLKKAKSFCQKTYYQKYYSNYLEARQKALKINPKKIHKLLACENKYEIFTHDRVITEGDIFIKNCKIDLATQSKENFYYLSFSSLTELKNKLLHIPTNNISFTVEQFNYCLDYYKVS
jgi:hypothetical protein